MNKTKAFSASILFLAALVPQFSTAQDTSNLPPEATEFYKPVPRVVMAGTKPGAPPADAVVLFNGSGLEEWQNAADGSKATWIVAGDVMTVNPGSGDIKTRQKFGDVQLHVEWRSPEDVKGEGQGRGNSGIFLMEQYEVQVLDSYKNDTYTNGQAGSIYKQSPPLVNVTRPPGEWNVYDILFRAPRFNEDGMLISPAKITVFHNGVVVQDNFELKGPTVYTGIPNYEAHPKELSIALQDHGNPVSFRNIWLRELK